MVLVFGSRLLLGRLVDRIERLCMWSNGKVADFGDVQQRSVWQDLDCSTDATSCDTSFVLLVACGVLDAH